MNCSGCGTPLKEGAVRCNSCGREIVLNKRGKKRKRAVYEAPSNRGLKIALVILSCALVLCLAVMAFYFGIIPTPWDSQQCTVCGENFEGEGALCEKCSIEEMRRKDCGMCGKTHTNEELLCDDCLSQIDEKAYSEGYFCFVCNEKIDRTEVTYISTAGFVFCGNCDEDYTCHECGRSFKIPDIAYEDGNDKYCYECYGEMVVAECGGCHNDILYDSDYKKVDETCYCMECYKVLPRGTCSGCGETIYESDDYYGDSGKYCCKKCYSGVCRICDEILIGYNYKKVDGRLYCYECYGGKDYVGDCEECGDKVFKTDAVEKNGKYYCSDCGELQNQ